MLKKYPLISELPSTLKGVSTYVYVAYASDASGTGFSLTPSYGLNFMAVLVTHTEIVSPVVGDFTGLWTRYIGPAPMVPRGLYNAGTTYAANDGVLSAEGYGYVSLVDGNIGHTPPTDGSNSAYWSCFAWHGTFDATQLIAGLYFNACINPQFQVNQRALASYTSATTPANNDDTYLIDQTNLLSDGNNIVSVSPEASVVPTSAPSAMKFTWVTANKKAGYVKFLENKDALKFAGKTISFQVKMATASGHAIRNARIAILTRTGTADVLTSDPVSSWGAEGANPTMIAEWTIQNTPANCALSNSYQIFKAENVSIPAGITNLAHMVWVDDADAASGDIIYFGDEQLNKGSVCLPFMPQKFSDDLFGCRKFLQKSWELETPLGTATDNGSFCSFFPVSTGYLGMPIRFVPEMAAVPTVHAYDMVGAVDKVFKGANGKAASLLGACKRGVNIYTADATSASQIQFHFVAYAEL